MDGEAGVVLGVFSILFTAGAAPLGHYYVTSWLKKHRLTGLSFGISLVDGAGQRSRLEHFLVQALRAQGATCVLAGRAQVQADILRKDVLDEMGWTNPQFALIGTVAEERQEAAPELADYTDAFWQWLGSTCPEAFPNRSPFYTPPPTQHTFKGETVLRERYHLSLKGAAARYTSLHSGLAAHELDAKDYCLVVRADCHCADGTIVASYYFEELVDDDDTEKDFVAVYTRLAEAMADQIRVNRAAAARLTAASDRPSFTREVFDGLVRVTHAANGYGPETDVLVRSATVPSREELIAADQPYQTQSLTER